MKATDVYLHSIIFSIFVLKITSIIMVFISIYLHITNNSYEHLINSIEHYIQMLFTINMGVLLIYLYHHYTPKKVCIEGHTKMYLYLFGILSLLGGFKKIIFNVLNKDTAFNSVLIDYVNIILK